jgi:exosortase/archaeosortase family protein
MKHPRSAATRAPTLTRTSVLRGGALFCSLVILLDLVVWYLSRGKYLAFLDIFTSWVIAGLIRLSGLHVVRDSNTIYLAHSTWIVSTECTAIFTMLIFSSFVLAYPATGRAKGIAVVAGLPFIFGANIARLFIMAWIDRLSPQYSGHFHNYVWQVAFIIMVVFMWLVWLDKVVDGEAKVPIRS